MAKEEQALRPASIAQRTETATADRPFGDFQSDRGSARRRRSFSQGSASTSFRNAFGETWSTAPHTKSLLDSYPLDLRSRSSPGNNHPAPLLRERAEHGGNRHSTPRRIPIRRPRER